MLPSRPPAITNLRPAFRPRPPYRLLGHAGRDNHERDHSGRRQGRRGQADCEINPIQGNSRVPLNTALSCGTYNRYRQVINDLLIPEFADKTLAEIKRSDCQVARGTAEIDKAVLTKVMTIAVKEKLLDASPAVGLDLPRVDRRTEKVKAITAWSEDTVHELVDASR